MISLNQIPKQPELILDFLKKNISLREICQKILHQIVINRAAAERGIQVTPEEIQGEADKIRRQKRLEKAADTLAWLKEEMLTADDWEAGICDRIRAEKLARHLFAKEAEKHFAQNRLDFEQVLLYQIVIPYEKLAQELFYQIEEEEISFYQAAHYYDLDQKRRYQCGYEGKLYRWNILPEISAAIFASTQGQIVGPIKTGLGYHIIKVEEFIDPQLTPELHEEIIMKMFDRWLEGEVNYLLHNQTNSDSELQSAT
ncbi:PpiC-type peptidyl-prolyl cis-trans isomerase [Stanieria cyanosphaera PCC 7437]|uniref:peptidylprolyl isomerase n=1 Tax=Stanieria cyanosphaera (strain ATCC 29371 / PCC 7437) TaxID=111780 RepID=K9XRX0_STAC7|nr:peptidylprolyl isomerase [Stanieria cyanosphaera]AFZ34422.1 PpiC-type peptidyl-prolyl cis-trans isomerase [Stanieria cyanosphaera PCC 7437]